MKLSELNPQDIKFVDEDTSSKPLKLSDLNKDDIKFVDEEQPSEAQDTAKAAAAALSSGATFGLADELQGAMQHPIGAYKEILNKIYKPLGIGEFTSDDVQEYKKVRDAYRAEQDRLAQVAPITSMAGEIAGGLLTGGTALKAAKLAGTPAGTVMDKIVRGAGQGAALGGTAGLGKSEEESLAGIAGDVVSSGGMGALFGGATEGVVGTTGAALSKLKNVIKDSEIGKKAAIAHELGTKGEKLKSLGEYRQDLRKTVGKEVLDEMNQIKEGVKKEYEELVDNASYGIDITKQADELLDKLQKVETYSDKDTRIVNRLIEKVKDIRQGKPVEKELTSTTFTPQEPIMIPAKVGTREKLEQEIIKRKAQADQLGVDAKFDIVESKTPDGKTMLGIREVIDEPIEATERVAVSKDGDILGLKPSKQDYQDLALSPSEDVAKRFKTSAKVTKPQIEEPSIPEQIIPQEPIATKKTINYTTREGGVSELTPKSFQELLKDLEGASGSMEFGEPAKQAQGAVKNFKRYFESEAGLKDTSGRYRELSKAKDVFGMDKENFALLPENEQIDKIVKIIEGVAKEGDSAASADKIAALSVGIEHLSKINPARAQKINNIVNEMSKRLRVGEVMSQSTAPTSQMIASTIGAGAGAAVGGPIGATIGATAAPLVSSLFRITPSKMILQGANLLGRAETNKAPDLINNIIKNARSKGNNTSKYVADQLEKINLKDDKARNATLFALEQNPDFRKALRKANGNEDSEK